MKTIFFFLALACMALAWSGRNARLENIPDRTWLYVGKYNGANDTLGGSSEVPWAYDSHSKVFVRVGGCTGGYTNAIVLLDLGTETTTAPWGGWDPSGPSDRPGGGCNRGICYDPVTRCIFELGGGASSDYGVYGYWRGDMAAGTWTHYRPGSAQGQAQVAADTANRVIINTWRSYSGFRYCTLYYPDGDSLVSAPVRPGSASTEAAINHDWWPSLQYAPGLGGTMYFGYMWMDSTWGYYQQQWFTWLFDAKTRTWRDLRPTGLEGVPETYVSQGPRPVLSWDNAANVMLLHISGVGLYVYHAAGNAWEAVAVTNPQILSSQMFDYDDEHNVHVLVDYNFAYDQDIWAFRYSNAPAETEARTAKAGPGIACSPNPAQRVIRIDGSLDRACRVRVSVFDLKGTLVSELFSGFRPQGDFSVSWKCGGQAPGLYLVRLEAGARNLSRTVLIVR